MAASFLTRKGNRWVVQTDGGGEYNATCHGTTEEGLCSVSYVIPANLWSKPIIPARIVYESFPFDACGQMGCNYVKSGNKNSYTNVSENMMDIRNIRPSVLGSGTPSTPGSGMINNNISNVTPYKNKK